MKFVGSLRCKFQNGEKVWLTNSDSMAAEYGARAIVRGYEFHDGQRYVTLEWIRDGLDNGQLDGGYEEASLTSMKPEWDN